MSIMLALLLAAAAPGEADTLARRVAEAGTLATILPLMQAKETGDLIAAHPELSGAEKDRLKATAGRVYQAGREKLMQSEASALVARLSIEDLRAMADYQASPAAAHYRAAMPEIIGATMKAMGAMDYKADVIAAYCKETGKLCPSE